MDTPSWLQIIITSAVTGALASGVLRLMEGRFGRRHAKEQALFSLRADVYRDVLTFFYNLPATFNEAVDRVIRESGDLQAGLNQMLPVLAPVRARLAIHATDEVRAIAKEAFAAVQTTPEGGNKQLFMDRYTEQVMPVLHRLADAMARELHP